MSEFDEMRIALRRFAEERGWPRFHDPKNLAMAVGSEVGELLAELRWLTSAESDPSLLSAEKLEAIRLEMADILIFLVRMADVLDVDLPQAVADKIAINEDRFTKGDSA